jgi:tripartite-type tricarboxylate transporter receptor subunit TctC
VAKIVADPSMKERFEALGAEPSAPTPAQTAAIMKADMDKWAGVIKKAGIKTQ